MDVNVILFVLCRTAVVRSRNDFWTDAAANGSQMSMMGIGIEWALKIIDLLHYLRLRPATLEVYNYGGRGAAHS
jgi:hypothetical protein